jgi:hypothetical protein
MAGSTCIETCTWKKLVVALLSVFAVTLVADHLVSSASEALHNRHARRSEPVIHVIYDGAGREQASLTMRSSIVRNASCATVDAAYIECRVRMNACKVLVAYA